MARRELPLSKDGMSLVGLVVDALADFVRAAAEHPQRLVILRTGEPVSPAELRRYCLALGGIRQYEPASEIRAIRNDPSIPNSTAMSDKPLPLHTDGTFLARPPERFMLSVVRPDGNGGGQSIFMPVSEILAAAPDWAIEALLTAHYLFPRGYDGDLTDSYVGPVLYRDGSTLRIRWRSDDIWRPRVIDPRGTDAAGAVDWLHEFLATSEPLCHLAEVGETVLVPNTVLLHGRTSLSADSPREVLRAWVVEGT